MINLTKSLPGPDVLEIEKAKKRGSYRVPEVLYKLREDFFDKCYICESKVNNVNVEHRIAHKDDRNLMFDWNNLYWSCFHCNNLKNKFYDNILDCTNEITKIDESIIHDYDVFPLATPSISSIIDQDKYIITAQLVHAVFNGSTPLKTIEAEILNENLFDEMRSFSYKIEINLKMKNNELNAEEKLQKEEMKLEIKLHLKNSSPFAAFKRRIVKKHSKLMSEFSLLLD